MGNNQSKKLAAIEFNNELQRRKDDAPRLARELEKKYNSPESKRRRHRVRMLMAVMAGQGVFVDL